MKHEDLVKEFERVLAEATATRTPMNIKLYFNSDGELEISTKVENTQFLTAIGNSEDSPLAPYLEKFASSFTKLKRKGNG